MKAQIEGIGTYRLILDTGYQLDLLQTIYVPSISRCLVSISKLDNYGFACNFGHGCFNSYKDSRFIGSGILIDGLYKLKLSDDFESLLMVHRNIGMKRTMLNENSVYLWHKRLGHISKERLERLIKNEILQNIDFTDLGLCVDCIKGKQTKHNKEPQEAPSFLNLYTLTYVDLLMIRLLMERNILLSLLMTFHVMAMSICLKKSLKQLMFLRFLLMKLKGN